MLQRHSAGVARADLEVEVTLVGWPAESAPDDLRADDSADRCRDLRLAKVYPEPRQDAGVDVEQLGSAFRRPPRTRLRTATTPPSSS